MIRRQRGDASELEQGRRAPDGPGRALLGRGGQSKGRRGTSVAECSKCSLTFACCIRGQSGSPPRCIVGRGMRRPHQPRGRSAGRYMAFRFRSGVEHAQSHLHRAFLGCRARDATPPSTGLSRGHPDFGRGGGLFHKTGWTVGGVLIWPLGSNGRHWLGAEGAIASSGVAYPAGGNRRSTESGGIRYERRFAPRSTTSLYVGAHALVVHSSNSDNPFISPGDFGSPVPRPNNEDFAGISGVGGGAGVLAGARMRVSTGCTLLTGISLDYLRVYSGQSTSTAWAWTVGMTFGQ